MGYSYLDFSNAFYELNSRSRSKVSNEEFQDFWVQVSHLRIKTNERVHELIREIFTDSTAEEIISFLEKGEQ